MEKGLFGIHEHTASCVDLGGGGGQGFKDAVAAWGAKPCRIEIVGGIHDIFGDIEVYDARASCKTDPQRTSHQLCHAVDRGDCAAPFGHGAGDIDLGEVLVSAAAFGIADPCAAGTCDQQNAVAFGLFDGDAGEDIGDSGSVACHTHAQTSRESGISASHVRCASFMAWGDQSDPVFFERRVKAKISSIDDAEYVLDAFCGQHPREDLTAFDLVWFCHLLFFLLQGAPLLSGGRWSSVYRGASSETLLLSRSFRSSDHIPRGMCDESRCSRQDGRDRDI